MTTLVNSRLPSVQINIRSDDEEVTADPTRSDLTCRFSRPIQIPAGIKTLVTLVSPRDPARAVPLAPVPAIESEIKKADPKDFVSEVAKLGRLVAKLTEGDAFGEQSFVMKTPSLASVRTMSYCDLLTLTSGDLEYVFTSYPSLKLKLHAYAIEQRAKYDEKLRRTAAAAIFSYSFRLID